MSPTLRHGVCWTWLALLLVPAGAGAAEVQTELRLRRGSTLQVAVLADGFHVGLLVEMNEHALREALLPLHLTSLTVQPFGASGELAVLGFAQPVKSARAELAAAAKPAAHRPSPPPKEPALGQEPLASNGPAAKGAPNKSAQDGNTGPATEHLPSKKSRGAAAPMQVAVRVVLAERQQEVLSHVIAERLPLPKTLAHHRIYDAEEALVAGRLAEAQLMLEGLRAGGPFAAWVALRLGDLAVHHEDLETACGHYLAAETVSDVRVAAQLAALRGRVLGCKEHMSVPWADLLTRDGRDDPVGLMLAKETQWALQYERDVLVLDQALAATAKPGEALPKPLHHSLAARRLRLRPPFEQLLANVRQPLLPDQAERFDLELLLGQALCALDIDGAWPRPAKGARTWAILTSKQRQELVAGVAGCRGLDSPDHVAALAKAEPSETATTLRELEQRIGAASRAAAKRTVRAGRAQNQR